MLVVLAIVINVVILDFIVVIMIIVIASVMVVAIVAVLGVVGKGVPWVREKVHSDQSRWGVASGWIPCGP